MSVSSPNVGFESMLAASMVAPADSNKTGVYESDVTEWASNSANESSGEGCPEASHVKSWKPHLSLDSDPLELLARFGRLFPQLARA